jgi:uncharacterized protein
MGKPRARCDDEPIMPSFPMPLRRLRPQRPRWLLRGLVAALAALLGSTGIEAQQRKIIFQLGTRSDDTSATESHDMAERWIDFESEVTGKPVRLHALWHPRADDQAPVMLYLHGARWDVQASAQRMQLLHELGFSVLGIDYRGFGRSSAELPSERTACEDARAAWRWLAARHPHAKRYVYGHSLGGAIGVQLAADVDDAAGLIVEGTFTSIPEVFGTLKWGWLPLRPLITQRFDSVRRVPHVKAPLLVVHGSDDELIRPEMGRALYERATAPKRFVLVEGGSHHDTHRIGHFQYRGALRELFGHPV